MATADTSTRSNTVPIIAVLACVAALAAGGLLTRPNLDWYATLQKPGFEPPNRAFTIVWPILYAMQAVAAWLAWKAPAKEEDRKLAFIFFFSQLALGVLWSFAFFWLQNPAAGLVVIMAFLIDIVITIVMFDRLSRTAALLLVPLALWVAYATALNFAFFMLN
jgi:tryptophan-rich sensory protein